LKESRMALMAYFGFLADRLKILFENQTLNWEVTTHILRKSQRLPGNITFPSRRSASFLVLIFLSPGTCHSIGLSGFWFSLPDLLAHSSLWWKLDSVANWFWNNRM
jgi:hypothetical protein